MTGPDAGTRDIDWSKLSGLVGERLRPVDDPLDVCRVDPRGPSCQDVLSDLRNPFAVGEHPASFHTTGWHGAFGGGTARYAVAAQSTDDVAAAVDFARENGVRLAVKGTGHDYLGRSRAPGGLLVWTHFMREITVHDSFTTAGDSPSPGDRPRAGVPALTVAAGTHWLEAYRALEGTGSLVSGGGCNTVGAAGGFALGGGYSSFARRFGTAAGNVVEMEVVTADGSVLVVSDHQHPDLFWALRGGGGGTFGVVTSATYLTHPAPVTLGGVSGTIQASSDRAYRALVEAVVDRMPALATEHWGEQVRFRPDRTVELMMTYINLSDDDARAVWRPLLDWIEGRPREYTTDVFVASGPFEGFWNAEHWLELFPDMISLDQRRGHQPGDFWWASNENEVSQYVDSYQSRWLPVEVVSQAPAEAAAALCEASRHHAFGIHVNKGLAGEAADARARDRTTSVNPAVFDALGLVICASLQPFAHPGLPGHEPDPAAATAGARAVTEAMAAIRSVSPESGSYVNETDYFEDDWPHSFWGDHYARLVEVKRRYDPDGVFNVHHGVGTE